MSSGRWPANVILDPLAAEALDQQSGYQRDGVAVHRNKNPDGLMRNEIYGTHRNGDLPDNGYGSGGGASRYFLTAWYTRDELAWIYANGLTPYAPEQ